MKKITLLIMLLLQTTFHAQEKNFSPFSIDASYGITGPIKPLSTNYDANSISPLCFAIGGRYMFNNYVGFRLSSSYHQLRNGMNSTTFKTNYFRVNMEAVINLGNLYRIDKAKKIGLILHTGTGYSIMREENWIYNSDEMLSVTLGLAPNFKLSQRLSLLVDFSIIGNIYQSRTFDFSEANIKRGLDGYLFNGLVGVNYTFGKKTPADWYIRENLSLKQSVLNKELDSLQLLLLDDDKDGVANYLDQEISSENAEVNSKGITIQKTVLDDDSDGIPNDLDECPFEKGSIHSKGCMDSDNDSIPDLIDNCPYKFGTKNMNGCPEIPFSLLNALNAARKQIVFLPKSSTLSTDAKQTLKTLANELMLEKDAKLIIKVHVSVTENKTEGLKISNQRAEAIKEYLISLGIDKDRIMTLGLGMNNPIAPIEDKQSNALNERVEFDINY